MCKLLLFNGGNYNFDELSEFIEDIDGLIVHENSFKINRGKYFLNEEIKVLIITPSEEIDELKAIAKQIKGNIKPIAM